MDTYELPPEVQQQLATGQIPIVQQPGKMLLSSLFAGDEYKQVREAVVARGYVDTNVRGKRLYVQTKPVGEDHEVVALAAVARDPGRTQDYIDTIQDFRAVRQNLSNRDTLITQYWQIYKSVGTVNTAISKLSAILSAGGTYKVRGGKKGKVRKATEQAQAVLDFFVKNVNNAPLEGVVTGARGLTAVTQQGVRQALVEGDWFGRTVWSSVQVGTVGKFDMPITIQSVPSSQFEPLAGLVGTGAEQWWWKPPADLMRQIEKPETKEVGDVLKRFVTKDILSQLKKNRRALLDPSLLLHIKHRSVDSSPFGESLIEPAKQSIAFQRSIEALEFVSMSNLINRLTIVMVGSSDPDSPYSDPNVALQRAALMQGFFDDPGPNMTIIWTGDDVKVEDVGAHSAVLQLDERHNIAAQKLKMDLGVPEALLTGSTSDGKAAGWAATIGASAQLEELRNGFQQVWTTLGERILLENGFTDIDIVFEFDNSMMIDKSEEANQLRQDYLNGALSIRAYLTSRGLDPDAEFIQRCFEQGLDANTALWKDAFMPIAGLQGQGVGAGLTPPTPGQPGQGRTPNKKLGKPATKPQERSKGSPVETK